MYIVYLEPSVSAFNFCSEVLVIQGFIFLYILAIIDLFRKNIESLAFKKTKNPF